MLTWPEATPNISANDAKPPHIAPGPERLSTVSAVTLHTSPWISSHWTPVVNLMILLRLFPESPPNYLIAVAIGGNAVAGLLFSEVAFIPGNFKLSRIGAAYLLRVISLLLGILFQYFENTKSVNW